MFQNERRWHVALTLIHFTKINVFIYIIPSFHIPLNIYYSNQSIGIPSIIHPVQWSALQSSSPICHCQALPQALTQALKVMWFGSTRFLGLSIWSTTSKEYSHCQDAQQALIMVLKPDCCPAWATVKNPGQTKLGNLVKLTCSILFH